jgi:hypothetical protein
MAVRAGTEGSNPACSSGESAANLDFLCLRRQSGKRCLRGMAAVLGGTRGLLARTQQTVKSANGTEDGCSRIGEGTAILSGRASQHTGSGVQTAALSIIPSLTGEGPTGGWGNP